MKKQQLQVKLIGFQREVLALSRELDSQSKLFREQQDTLFLDLANVLDAFENIFNSLREKEDNLDKPTKKAIKSFQRIYRKLIRILEENGIKQVEFPGDKAAIGSCKIIDTETLEGAPEGQVITVVRHGYQHKERILRPAEVITVSNR